MESRWAMLGPVLICLSILGIHDTTAADQRSLLAVVSVDSPMTSIAASEVRKLFLGVPVSKDNIRLKALRNNTDAEIQKVFLQKVIFMSERSYERRLLSIIFRYGGDRPQIFKNLPDLIHA